MGSQFKTILAKLGPFIGLLLVIGLFSIPSEMRESFLTFYNFKVIFTQTVIVAIAAYGMTLIIISGGIDLSVGSAIALCSVVGAQMLLKGYNDGLVVLAVVGIGALIGLINGTAIACMRMTPFIITLGTLGIWRGAAKLLSDSQTVNYDTDASAISRWMTTSDPFGYELPAGVWVTLALGVLTALLLRGTVFGRHIFAIGSNEATARLCGLSTTRLKILIYVPAGAFLGLAGLFQLSRMRQGDPTAAIGLELDIIAAVIIGGASLNGGVGTIMGSIIGALIMSVLRNATQMMGWQTPIQEIIIGLVIIVAVFLDRLRQNKAAT